MFFELAVLATRETWLIFLGNVAYIHRCGISRPLNSEWVSGFESLRYYEKSQLRKEGVWNSVARRSVAPARGDVKQQPSMSFGSGVQLGNRFMP